MRIILILTVVYISNLTITNGQSKMMFGDTIHLFYQTYGNAENDAICHAESINGIDFIRNPTNPVFRPHDDWNCGRT